MIEPSSPAVTQLLTAVGDLGDLELGALLSQCSQCAAEFLDGAAADPAVADLLRRLAVVQLAMAGLVAVEAESRVVDLAFSEIVGGE